MFTLSATSLSKELDLIVEAIINKQSTPVTTSFQPQEGALKPSKGEGGLAVLADDQMNLKKLKWGYGQSPIFKNKSFLQLTNSKEYLIRGIDKGLQAFQDKEYETSSYYFISRTQRLAQCLEAINRCKPNDKIEDVFKRSTRTYLNRQFPKNFIKGPNKYASLIQELLRSENWNTRSTHKGDSGIVYEGDIRTAIFHSYLENRDFTKATAFKTGVAFWLVLHFKQMR